MFRLLDSSAMRVKQLWAYVPIPAKLKLLVSVHIPTLDYDGATLFLDFYQYLGGILWSYDTCSLCYHY